MAPTVLTNKTTEFFLNEGGNSNGIQFEEKTFQDGNHGQLQRKINVYKETPDSSDKMTIFNEVSPLQEGAFFEGAIVGNESEELAATLPALLFLGEYESKQEKSTGSLKRKVQRPITSFYPPLANGLYGSQL